MALNDALTPEERERARRLAGRGGQQETPGGLALAPFPIDDLPWPYRDLLELIAPTTEAPIEGLLLALFCAIGAALGRKVHFPVTPLLYPMIWGLVLAPPYFYRKGTVAYWAERIARELVPGLKVLNGLGSIERVNETLSATEGVKLFIRVAELGGTISKAQRSGTSNLIADACALYDHEEGWETGTKQSKPSVGYEVTLLGLSTLKGLKPVFREAYVSGGFLRRLVIVQATERPPVADQPAVDHERLNGVITELRSRIDRYQGKNVRIGLDPHARRAYEEWYKPWRERCKRLPEEQMEVAGGTESLIRKLALQRAALENKNQITQEIIAWVIRWGGHFEAHTLTVAGELALSGVREIEERILALMQKQPRRPWEIRQQLSSPPASHKLRQILDGMVSIGLLTKWSVPRPAKGSGEWFGRPGSEPANQGGKQYRST